MVLKHKRLEGTVLLEPTPGRIKALALEIARQFHPQKILLFGSYAYGKPTPDSDVDLLVIMETRLSTLRQAAEIAQAVGHPFPLDILVRTPKQVQERTASGDFFLREVLAKGKLLYEATDERMG